jgi:hypothetical protein
MGPNGFLFCSAATFSQLLDPGTFGAQPGGLTRGLAPARTQNTGAG